MGERGPDPKKLNWEEFDKLVSFQCTQEEIAAFFDISVDTLDRCCIRDRGEKLADIWDKKKLLGRVKLRKIQFAIAEKGGPGAATMSIWLDKKMNPSENPDRPIPPPTFADARAIATEKARHKTFAEFCEPTGYPVPFDQQVQMQEFAGDDGEPRLLLGARGYGKTDYVTVLGVAYLIYLDWFFNAGKKLTETNLIISKSKIRNAAIIDEIATALKINGVPLSKKNASCLRVQGLIGKDHSVEAIPIKASFRGRHPKRILMDDPVTEEDISEATRRLVKVKYDEAYKLCKNIVIIGQPAHAFDLYASLRKILKKLEMPHGTIPELDADLVAMKAAGVDANSIEMSYHLRIPEDGTSPFAKVQYIDAFPPGEAVAFIDPSDGGDFTAVTILKMIGSAFVVEGHAWQRAWYLCDELPEVMIRLGVRRAWFETNATGTQPIVQLRELLKAAQIGILPSYTDTNKEAVIMQAGTLAHMIHLSRGSNKAYTEQVTQYGPKAKYDDSPDSLARCLEKLGFIRGKK